MAARPHQAHQHIGLSLMDTGLGSLGTIGILTIGRAMPGTVSHGMTGGGEQYHHLLILARRTE